MDSNNLFLALKYLLMCILFAPLLPLIPYTISKLLLRTLDPKVQKLLEEEK